MIKQGSVKQIRTGEISRNDGYIIITMCHYPRGLKKGLKDEYRADFAPTRELLKDFNESQLLVGHEEAFLRSQYESRFVLKPGALEHLRTTSERAEKQDVYFICQCEMGERCHREILMLIAHEKFRAPIDKVFHEYPVVMERFRKNQVTL
ncbi:MAG: DUF488 family protein [Bdellovibrionota bacterium]